MHPRRAVPLIRDRHSDRQSGRRDVLRDRRGHHARTYARQQRRHRL